jgi:putative inorganic carbon (hco3(-)) transporter
MSTSAGSPNGPIRRPTGALGKENALTRLSGSRLVGTALAPATWQAVSARAVAAMLAVALGYTAARISGSSTAPSYAILVFGALALVILAFIYGLARVLLAAAILGIPFQWDKNFFYDYGASAYGAIGGVSISITTLALIGLYALWLTELLLNLPDVERPRLRWALPLSAYFAVAALSLTVASDRRLALYELALLTQCLLLFIYVSSRVTSLDKLHTMVLLLLFGLTIHASFLVLQYFTGVSISFFGISSSERVAETTRVGGTLGSPNAAGGFLASCIAIAVALLVARGDRSSRVLPTLAVFIGALALVLTFSRGGWLAATIAVTLLLCFFFVRGQLTKRILLLGLIVGVLGFIMGGQIQARLQSQSGGLGARVSLGEVAVDVIRDHPLMGVGANNYVTVLPKYASLTAYTHVPHNKFLLVWSETGIVGLLAFIFFLLAAARQGWLALRHADEELAPYAGALSAAFIALFVHMNFEPYHTRSHFMFLFLVAGLLYAAARVARKRDAFENDSALFP